MIKEKDSKDIKTEKTNTKTESDKINYREGQIQGHLY